MKSCGPHDRSIQLVQPTAYISLPPRISILRDGEPAKLVHVNGVQMTEEGYLGGVDSMGERSLLSQDLG